MALACNAAAGNKWPEVETNADVAPPRALPPVDSRYKLKEPWFSTA
jgi:hypothetical protein